MSTAEQIEELYTTSFNGPFPYQDCFQLLKERNESRESLIPELDWYFATVAGYSHSATRLNAKSAAELEKAEKLLSKSFCEYFPEFEPYRPLIDEKRTPNLHGRLQVVEKLRLGLLDLVHQPCLDRV